MQRTPSYDGAPPGACAVPTKNCTKPADVTPLAWSSTVSGFVNPIAAIFAPFRLNEFAQPASAAPLGLGTKSGEAHGHGVGSDPSPKQNAWPVSTLQPASIAMSCDGVSPAIVNAPATTRIGSAPPPGSN